MVRQRLTVLAWTLVAGVLGFGWNATQAAEQGHGGGAGHAVGGFGPGPGRHFGYGPAFRGYYGYPGWFGVGLGLGVGCGYGWGYGYPYGPYGYGYPVYVDPISGLPANAYPPAGPVPAQGAGPVVPAPVRLTDTDLLLSIRVHPDAVVRINGVPTTQNGPRREFLSSGLAPGRLYTFVVTAQWTGSNGQAVELERRIRAQGGERRTVDFTLPSPPPENELPPGDRAGR